MSANIKVNRRILYEKVQEIIGNGVIEGEEVDLTSKKVLDEIWTIINFLNLPFKERLKAKMPSEEEIIKRSETIVYKPSNSFKDGFETGIAWLCKYKLNVNIYKI